MPTKKRPAICPVPSGKKPTKSEYWKICRWLDDQSQKAAEDGDELPVPHLMPPYGGPCWQQCYREALAYKEACKTRAAWLAARYGYEVAWDATESCLSGFPV